MVNRAQFFFENNLNISDILKGNRAIIKMSLSHLPVNNTIHKTTDIFLCILSQATGRLREAASTASAIMSMAVSID